MKWFKFYGQDFLTDPKMSALTLFEKMCWIVLLCMANAEDKSGYVENVSVYDLMTKADIEYDSPYWHTTADILEKLSDLGMIKKEKRFTANKPLRDLYTVEIVNYKKRQEVNLTDAERAKRYRNKHKTVKNEPKITETSREEVTPVTEESDESNARIDKKREEENRKEKKRFNFVNTNEGKSILSKLKDLKKDPEQVEYMTDELVDFLKDEESRDYIRLASWKLPDSDLFQITSELKEPGVKDRKALFTSKVEKKALSMQLRL